MEWLQWSHYILGICSVRSTETGAPEINDQTPIKQKLNYVDLHFQIIPNKLPCVGDTSIKAKL